jgi:hypothetical protein
MNEKQLAQEIINEAKHWTENQFTLTAGISSTSTSQHELRARMELIDHIKKTYQEMRENA